MLPTAGKAHLAGIKGEIPENPENWGYKVVGKVGTYNEYEAQGSKIGWLPDNPKRDGVYLESEAAYAVVQQLAQQQGEPISMSRRMLSKRMKEQGVTFKTQDDRNTYKTTIEGKQRQVIKLSPEYLSRIGIIGIVEINETKSSVDEDFIIPNNDDYPDNFGIPMEVGASSQSDESEESSNNPENPDKVDVPPSKIPIGRS